MNDFITYVVFIILVLAIIGMWVKIIQLATRRK